MMATDMRLKIGGVIISLVPGDDDAFHIVKVFESFRCDDEPGEPEIQLRVHVEPVPTIPTDELLFDSGGVWRLYRSQDRWAVYLRSAVPASEPYQLAVLETDGLAGDIYIRPDHQQYLFPLAYPLGEVLMINVLGRGYGVLLHACGVRDGEKGLIFAGTSGAGKSTSAGLWHGQAGVTVLSDDRVIVRKQEGRFWVYGTPFHGSAWLASPQAAPLERIFILKHATENQITPLNPADAAARLLVRAFPPYWDAEAMAFTLQLLGEIAQTVPCYELGFVPDQSVVDFVRAELS